MKIAVIGATGGTGKPFIMQALEHQHHVTALARSPQKLDIQHPQLEVIAGDALQPEDVRRVVTGQDAVLCALGSGNATGKVTTRQDGTRHIIEALAAAGEQPHLVVISSLAVGDSKAQVSFMVRSMIAVILRNPLADHEAQEALVMHSALPWTIIRPTALGDGPLTGQVRATLPPQPVESRPPIARADVAYFALNVMETRGYLQQAVTLTVPPSA